MVRMKQLEVRLILVVLARQDPQSLLGTQMKGEEHQSPHTEPFLQFHQFSGPRVFGYHLPGFP